MDKCFSILINDTSGDINNGSVGELTNLILDIILDISAETGSYQYVSDNIGKLSRIVGRVNNITKYNNDDYNKFVNILVNRTKQRLGKDAAFIINNTLRPESIIYDYSPLICIIKYVEKYVVSDIHGYRYPGTNKIIRVNDKINIDGEVYIIQRVDKIKKSNIKNIIAYGCNSNTVNVFSYDELDYNELLATDSIKYDIKKDENMETCDTKKIEYSVGEKVDSSTNTCNNINIDNIDIDIDIITLDTYNRTTHTVNTNSNISELGIKSVIERSVFNVSTIFINIDDVIYSVKGSLANNKLGFFSIDNTELNKTNMTCVKTILVITVRDLLLRVHEININNENRSRSLPIPQVNFFNNGQCRL